MALALVEVAVLSSLRGKLVGRLLLTSSLIFFGVTSNYLKASAHSGSHVLEFLGTPIDKIEVSGFAVNVHEQAAVSLAGFPRKFIYLTGYGIYVRKVGVLNLNVYTAVNYIDSMERMSSQEPLSDIRRSSVEALQLTALMDLTAEQMRGAFEDSLIVNGIDTEDPHVRAFLDEFDVGARAGDAMTIVSMLTDGEEILLFESPYKTTQFRRAALGFDFWRVYFGVPLDDGIKKLKNQLIYRRPQ